MRVIIAGGRKYEFTQEDYQKLDDLHKEIGITLVVSGCAWGADTCGERWAVRKSIPIEEHPPDYKKYGGMAPLIRNTKMAEVADAVVLFPGGNGTADMYRKAVAKGLKIYDWR